MKRTITAISLALCGMASAQLQGGGGIILGGGYLEDPGKGYAFAQIRGTLYEDDAFAHHVFLEILGHGDDAELTYASGGSFFTEDGDIAFVNVTANYELEMKLSNWLSVYGGGGLGAEFVSLDDEFDYNIDNDTNFVAQTFVGLRAQYQNGFAIQAGARYIFREDFSLLGDQFITNDSWAFEVGAGFSF
ncbi:MAG: hypothetical protein Q7Q71_02510 [Verrucomicrobiota bacterium JB023]|nr:hypothetical protein [Verrucomicrobiota bacterium JB023]